MKSKFLNGVTILILANLFGKFLGMIYRIPLTNVLGAEGMGLYQMTFPLYSFCLIIVAGGIPTALSKLIGEARAEKRYDNASSYFNNALIICLIFGLCFSLVFFLFGKEIAKIQGNESAGIGYLGMAIAVFFASISACFKGYFQGYEDMKPTAFSTIIEQTFKLILGITLALSFLKKGIEFAVFGAILGMAISEFLSFLFLSIYLTVNKKKFRFIKTHKKEEIKKLTKISIPFTLMSIITPLTTLIESFFVVNILSNYLSSSEATALYGIQTGMINPIINFPVIISSCLGIALLPNLSYAIKSNQNIENMVENSYKYIWIFVVACTFGYFSVGNVLLSVLFPSIMIKYESLATNLFLISSLSIVFLSLAQTSTSIMQAKGKIYTPVINLSISSIIRIILCVILLYNKNYNILGLAFANTLSYGIYALLNIISVKELFSFHLGLKNILLPLASALIMFMVCGFFINILTPINRVVALVIATIIGVVVYFTLLFIFGVISKEEFSKIQFKKNKKSV